MINLQSNWKVAIFLLAWCSHFHRPEIPISQFNAREAFWKPFFIKETRFIMLNMQQSFVRWDALTTLTNEKLLMMMGATVTPINFGYRPILKHRYIVKWLVKIEPRKTIWSGQVVKDISVTTLYEHDCKLRETAANTNWIDYIDNLSDGTRVVT